MNKQKPELLPWENPYKARYKKYPELFHDAYFTWIQDATEIWKAVQEHESKAILLLREMRESIKYDHPNDMPGEKWVKAIDVLLNTKKE